jgi:hypothetical protein
MKVFSYAVLATMFGILSLGCNKSENLSQEQILEQRKANRESAAPRKRAPRPYDVTLTSVKSKETSPAALTKAVESLSWVEPGSVTVDFDQKSIRFRIKEGQKLNADEAKKAIEATGEAKVEKIARAGSEQ